MSNAIYYGAGCVVARPAAGPHCEHRGECPWERCERSGYVETPCTFAGCRYCGAPSPQDWASRAYGMATIGTLDDAAQFRIWSYWRAYVLVRRTGDPARIPPERERVGMALIEGPHNTDR